MSPERIPARSVWKRSTSYVWCDAHGSIHTAVGDPFDEAHVGFAVDCTPCHRPVAVLTEDSSEEF